MYYARMQTTIREIIYKSYAHVAMAHAALEGKEPVEEYQPIHFGIRKRLFNGLMNGSMKIGSMWDEEKKKIKFPRCCYYCGAEGKLTIDHLIPRAKSEIDTSDNLVYACSPCNSSKRDTDLLAFYARKEQTPPISLLVRYLKLCFSYCEQNDLLDKNVNDIELDAVPFDVRALPQALPQPKDLKYFVVEI